MNIEDNNGKGFLSGNDNGEIEENIAKIKEEFNKIDNKNNQLTDEEREKMLKELQAETNKKLKEINEKFDIWYGKNRDYLMREYIDEHQKEFRDFCGKIFMEEDEDEENDKAVLSDEDLKI